MTDMKMDNYGIEIYNAKGELFYDTNVAGEYLTFTKKHSFSVSKGVTYWNSGVPASEKCVMFFKYTRSGDGSTAVGVMEQRDGYWQAAVLADNTGAVIYIYVFSSLTPPKQDNSAYGIQIWDSKGREIIHNTARPLVCHPYTVGIGSRPPLQFPAASTGSMLGFYQGARQHAIVQTNNNIIDIVRIFQGSADQADYTTSLLIIDTRLYD